MTKPTTVSRVRRSRTPRPRPVFAAPPRAVIRRARLSCRALAGWGYPRVFTLAIPYAFMPCTDALYHVRAGARFIEISRLESSTSSRGRGLWHPDTRQNYNTHSNTRDALRARDSTRRPSAVADGHMQ